MEYFYRIKIPQQAKDFGFDNTWDWNPIHIGITPDLKDRKEARQYVCDYHDIDPSDLCLRSKSSDIGIKNIYLLNLFEMDEYWTKIWTEKHTCNNQYTKLQIKQMGELYNTEFCSIECKDKHNETMEHNYSANYDYNGVHKAVIYKITNKITKKCYIGKTTQAFTLRWYQHFFSRRNW